MQISLIELWHSMGFLARGVVYVLCIMSIWSLWVAIDKFILFTRAKRQSFRFIQILTQELGKKNLKPALELTRKFKKSHLAKVANAGIQEFLRITESSGNNPTKKAAEGEEVEGLTTLERIQHAMERTSTVIVNDFKKGLSAEATIGATAPFVGLFGTVVGIINAFQAIKTAGAGAIGQVSGGIAEALITTAFGLFVAIPAVWFFNYFTVRAERIGLELSNVTADLLDYFIDLQEA